MTTPTTQHAPPLPKAGHVPKPTGRPPKPPSPFPKIPRAALLRMSDTMPRGPKLYHAGPASFLPKSGPGLAPPGFLTKQESQSEWTWYWASMRVLDPERDPRKPPFWGGRAWSYQSQELANMPGVYLKSQSTSVDFMYLLSYPYIAVRIQTFRYHLSANAFKQGYDTAQLMRLYGAFATVDVFEQDYLSDPSGRAAILLLKRTLGLERNINPIDKGSVQPIRNPFSIS